MNPYNILKFISDNNPKYGYKETIIDKVDGYFPEDGEGFFDAKGKQGKWVKYRSDGKTILLIVNFINNKKEGEFMSFYPDGAIATKGFYKDNVENGLYSTFYSDGSIKFTVNSKMGRWNGIFKQYYFNGNLWMKGEYIAGNKEGEWEKFRFNGDLHMRGKYVNDIEDGIWEIYDENGKLTYYKYDMGYLISDGNDKSKL